MKPRLLDLFCGAGGAAMGYSRWFEVVGVDIVDQPHYPFQFHQADALSVLDEMTAYSSSHVFFGLRFDAIHASPPCQAYTTMNNRHSSIVPPLIWGTRDALRRSTVPWVIENVPGALRYMRSPIELTGEMFGLGVHRPRLFESNVMFLVPPRPTRQRDAAAVYGKQDGRRLWTRADGTELHVADLKTASAAMQIDWMTWDEIREAIPPAYTCHIGEQLLAAVKAAA